MIYTVHPVYLFFKRKIFHLFTTVNLKTKSLEREEEGKREKRREERGER
jgi:hypothetical protein